MSQEQEFLAALVRNAPVGDLPEKVRQAWIENPNALWKVLRASLLPAQGNRLEVWKTVKLGTGIRGANAFREAFKADGMHLGIWADDILGQEGFTVAPEEAEVYLVVVKVEELGFEKGATRQDIYAAAKKRGLELCPAEVGPQLRLQYPDQPRDEWLIVGMEPTTDSAGHLRLFDVGYSDGARWLNGDYVNCGLVWRADDRFVFIQPRN